MEKFAEINECSEDFILIQQKNVVFVVNQWCESMVDLNSGKCRKIKEDLCGVVQGDRVQEIVLTEETARGMRGDVPDLRNRAPPGVVVTEFKEKPEEPSCKFNPSLSSNLSTWMLAATEMILFSHDRELSEVPSLWSISINGEVKETFISRVKPQVVMYNNIYYAFIYCWDESIHVYTSE